MKTKLITPFLLSMFFAASANSADNINTILPSGKTVVMEKMEAWKFGQSLDELNELVMKPSFNPFVEDRSGLTTFDYARAGGIKPIEYYLGKKEFKTQYRSASKMQYEEFFSGDAREGLIRAVSSGALPAVKAFLVKNPDFDLNYELGVGITPLAATSLIKDVDLAGLMFITLVEAGADVNQKLTRLGGDSLGHVFCASDNFLMLLLAISKGYDINLRNEDGADVYEYSYQSGSLHCGQHLENIMNALNEQIL